mmetsp:Transcript_60557/g.171498  ORF Transcript_60557/g.171498 Transcript_60557/m.171498 type:complete len:96 (+) Transcript_60557:324-611(+)
MWRRDKDGARFFCMTVDEPEGNTELLLESVKAMNANFDFIDEERRGGSGHIGKMVLSAGVNQLSLVASVAKHKQTEGHCNDASHCISGPVGRAVH